MLQNRLTLWGTLALVVIATVGCGGSGLDSVSGKVMVGDQPLTTGNVTFKPVAGGAIGTATIQSDGSFTAYTGSLAGLAPGDYEITVIADGPMPKGTPQNPEPLPERLTADKYANPKTSGLKCSVPLKAALELKLDPR